jgi:hypothetical protein
MLNLCLTRGLYLVLNRVKILLSLLIGLTNSFQCDELFLYWSQVFDLIIAHSTQHYRLLLLGENLRKR